MVRRLDPLALLTRADLDLSRPFSTIQAHAAGLNSRQLGTLVDAGLLRRPVRGVYAGTHLDDSLEFRIACLRLVVPPDAVVTDRTAGWLHGAAMVLAPGDHLVVPPVSVFQAPGNRLRNSITRSGERGLRPSDVIEVGGLKVTTPLRTACDLGRLLNRVSAFAALDAMLRLGRFSHDDLLGEVESFRGYRGVRKLRAFAPLADAGAESYGESALRLRWYDAGGLPRPKTQVPVDGGVGLFAFLDIGIPDLRFGAEYDGAAYHGEDQEEHDRSRRTWLADEGWQIEVFRQNDVFGKDQCAEARLRRGVHQATLRGASE